MPLQQGCRYRAPDGSVFVAKRERHRSDVSSWSLQPPAMLESNMSLRELLNHTLFMEDRRIYRCDQSALLPVFIDTGWTADDLVPENET